jgi:hypothetical protein
MVVSGVNFQGTYQGGEMRLVLANYDYASTAIADAWHFEAGGCNTDQLTSSTAAFSKTCPKLEGLRPLPLFQYDFNFPGSEALPNSGFLQWFTAFGLSMRSRPSATRSSSCSTTRSRSRVRPTRSSPAATRDADVRCPRRYGYLNDVNAVVDTDVSWTTRC